MWRRPLAERRGRCRATALQPCRSELNQGPARGRGPHRDL
uniref:Putative small nuclear ribonucleoprotein D3 polypeptide 18 kDa variant 1 n=1 Tax=Taeniopygia guttata TaxID=59729 RepID=B5G3I1_TAEGU|nr:putative small nuclear ribonucleoprotein D3 polypeptide 18 kDa variant 1 [Taeniopygia guttata]